MTGTELKIDGRKVRVSNLEKILYPATGFRKADVIDYYVRVAPVLLPHLRDRALTLKRYPNGVAKPFFYEKEAPSHRPSWVKTAAIWSDGNDRDVHYVVVNQLPTLAWVANLASLELHTPLGRIPAPARPTMVVFDLDPGPGANIVNCCDVALALREALEKIDLQAFPKTSGSKGLQTYVPLNTPANFERSKAFAHAVASAIESQRRDVVTDMSRRLRTRKVLIDWSQNTPHKTTVTAYSLRGTSTPSVSTPLNWKEVEHCFRKRNAKLLAFGPKEVLRRIERHGDLFAPVLDLKQRLPRQAS
jgi:bifunctional non-homologous end joining protein LigD